MTNLFINIKYVFLNLNYVFGIGVRGNIEAIVDIVAYISDSGHGAVFVVLFGLTTIGVMEMIEGRNERRGFNPPAPPSPKTTVQGDEPKDNPPTSTPPSDGGERA